MTLAITPMGVTTRKNKTNNAVRRSFWIAVCTVQPELHREKVASASVARRMTQFAHRTSLNLTDALASQIERFTDFLEGSWLASVESEAQRENLTLTWIERCE